ncbi:MAG TPA: DMT family transporter [Nitrospirota bacterium]|nr:DMT family transporter [Nitrospirota bacterium]
MKTYIVIMIAALSAAVGESLLSFGMRRYGSMNLAEPSHWLVLISSVFRNPYVFLGIVFLSIFFFLYLAALSWADLSFVLPLTAVSYLFAALLAKFFLKEEVSWHRWAGTIIIVIGIALVALGGKSRSSDVPLPVPPHHGFTEDRGRVNGS